MNTTLQAIGLTAVLLLAATGSDASEPKDITAIVDASECLTHELEYILDGHWTFSDYKDAVLLCAATDKETTS